MARIYRTIAFSIKAHFLTLFRQLDPVEIVPSEVQPSTSKSSINSKQFIFPIFVLLFINSYGSFWFHHKPVKFENFTSNPYMYTHQISPQSVWSQIDYGIGLNTIASVVVYLSLIFTGKIKPNCKMYQISEQAIVVGDEELVESKRIIDFRNKTRNVIQFITWPFYGLFLLFFYSNVLKNGVYLFNLETLVFWIALLPLIEFYMLYALFAVNLFIVLTSRCIRMRQQNLIQKLSQINLKLSKLKVSKHHKHRLLHQWRKFLRTNIEVAQMCESIKEYTRYCMPLISTIVPYFISVQCYEIYLVLFVPMQSNHMVYFIIIIVELNLVLFGLINECASVTKYNQEIEVLNRKFYVNFMGKNGIGFIKRGDLIKMESFHANSRLHLYSFQMFGYYRVTSELIYLAMTYISAYFLFVFKNQYHQQ